MNFSSIPKAWPFQEAKSVLDRCGGTVPEKGYLLFETGYGPSGLPHIGTFGEVARTIMVRHAFSELSDIPTRLFAFSDDMDALRKVPGNVPNQDMLAQHLGRPLTKVPDPFGAHESFGQHNNARLQSFLDQFGFDDEFQSSTECYQSGRFDQTLMAVLENYDDVINVVLPTLGAERQATYSPFLPVSEKTGRVLQVPVLERNADAGTIVYQDEDGTHVETLVTGGRCKLQWKVDWAMRWRALDVDYEMSGKDLIDSVRLSSRICKILGGKPPAGFIVELFLDQNGEKISKSRGNGISIDEWLTYASAESLSLYMFQSPRKAKRLFFDVIPKTVDEYISHLHKYADQDEAAQAVNPAWHIHAGNPPKEEVPLSFAVLLNLVAVCNTEDPSVLWGFIGQYEKGASPENHPLLDRLVGNAIAYYRDFVKPNKKYRAPDDNERAALEDLLGVLQGLPEGSTAEDIQTQIYEIGKRHEFVSLRDWFRALYETLFGQSEGPRMGSFVALYGIDNFTKLIEPVLAGKLPVAAD